MCTERKATGLFVLTSFLCDNDCGTDDVKKFLFYIDIQTKKNAFLYFVS